MVVLVNESKAEVKTCFTYAQIMQEHERLKKLISDPVKHEIGMWVYPRDSSPEKFKKVVEDYRSEIITELDSQEVIGVPSMPHRDLHELIWCVDHFLYEGAERKFKNLNQAIVDFVRKPNLIERFDIYYSWNYILPALEEGRVLSKGMESHLKKAERESLELFGKELGKLSFRELIY